MNICIILEKIFFKSKGMLPFGSSISDYKEEAIKYLNDSFPFCFNIDILNDPLWNGYYLPSEKENIENYILYLGYYAMCLGADEIKLRELPNVLKDRKMIKLKKSERLEMSDCSPITGAVNLDEVLA